jgi:Spy/CpxP family protein refolding chaperone
MKRSMKSTIVLAGILMLSMVGSAFAQRGTVDPLRGLKKALEQAVALPLTTTQEEQLKTLIQTYRDSQTQEPSEALQAALDAYDAAILDGNQAAANAQATIIANLRATAANARLQAETTFKLAVIALLKTNGDQTGLLRTKFGDDGFLRILDGLAGGHGGHGGPSGGGGGRR